MALRQLDRDLWCVDHADFRVGGLRMGARTTVVRLPDASLVLHSPGPLDDADAAAIAALGPVSSLLAPTLLPHGFLAPARARFPEARIAAPVGLGHKRKDLRIELPLGPDTPSPWPGVL